MARIRPITDEMVTWYAEVYTVPAIDAQTALNEINMASSPSFQRIRKRFEKWQEQSSNDEQQTEEQPKEPVFGLSLEPKKPEPEPDGVTIPINLWKAAKEVIGAAATCENPQSLSVRAKPLYRKIRNI